MTRTPSVQPIPCTVAILTRNSEGTLTRALESVRDFAEIIICDGGSTDDTLAIAKAFGARILSQSSEYLDGDGRILNYSGVRNQTLASASYSWFLVLDSDEYIDTALRDEVRDIVLQQPRVFWVPRKYEYLGKKIDCSVAYPSQQLRLFHKDVVHGFIKSVHERIQIKSGTETLYTKGAMIVPLPHTARELVKKWRTYIDMENKRKGPVTFRGWSKCMWREAAIGVRYVYRLGLLLLSCKGNRLPIQYELARVWYQFTLVRESMRYINKF